MFGLLKKYLRFYNYCIYKNKLTKGKSFKRRFNKQYYTKHQWLCGCTESTALYCFPCILFGGEDAWTKTGFKNLSKLSQRTKTHAKSSKHIDSMVSFNLLGKNCIQVHLNKSYQDSIAKHNEQVSRKNYNWQCAFLWVSGNSFERA